MSANHVNTGDNTFSHTHMNAVPTAWKAELINPKTGCMAFSHNQTAMSPNQPNTGDRTFCQTSRSEEHTSELQSRGHLVCRLLLEKKKTIKHTANATSARSVVKEYE